MQIRLPVHLVSIRQKLQTYFQFMGRRSSSIDKRPSKRPKIEFEDLAERYRNGVMLAPMVRSGARKLSAFNVYLRILLARAVPTRLMALKFGAKLVWGPEIVDKAILHATRNVDRECSKRIADVIMTVYKLRRVSYHMTA